jgi:glycosyltransferase involved in cell wall biosynthesis
MSDPSDSSSEAPLQGIRIARVSTVPFFVLTQLRRQLFAMAEKGAQVTVVTSDGPELLRLKGTPSIELVPLEIQRFIAPWRDLLSLLRLWWFFKNRQITITHSTTPKAGLLTAIASFMAGVPIRIHTYTGQPWVGMSGVKGWLARRSDWLIGRLNTCCYADSASQREFLINQLIVKEDRLHVIGAGSLSGVDLQRFDRDRFSANERDTLRESLGIPLDAEIILFVGRITREKGVRELLDAFSGLKNAGFRAHLILVGPLDVDSGTGGVIIQDEITSICDTHFVGYTEIPEQFMAIADILCLPSYREGFGTVVIEAAAMGLSTVGSNICGLVDAIVDEETGILVTPCDVMALQEALVRLLSDAMLRTSMGVAARRRVFGLFDAKRINNLVIEEYCRHLQFKGIR